MDRKLSQKMNIKPGYSCLMLNSPGKFLSNGFKADRRPKAGLKYDVVLLFVHRKSEIATLAPKAIQALKEDGLLWAAYPKKTSGIKTDVSRDHGWETFADKGLEAVSLIAIDETWSALRFRPKGGSKKKRVATSGQKEFTAVIETPGDLDGGYVTIPFDVEKTYGTKGQVKVKAWFDGYPYRGVLANMGTGCHIIIVRKDIRKAIGKNAGDKVDVVLEHDTQERVVDVPDDLQDALARSVKAKKFFDSLSFTNRKEYAVWVAAAKKAETRGRRLEQTLQKLLSGKKNPSEK